MTQETIFARLDTLLEKKQMNEIHEALLTLNVVDIAEFMEELEENRLLKFFRILPKDMAADVFAYLDNEKQQELIELISDGEINALIDDMFLDDTVDFLEELPAVVVKRILQNTNAQKRELINRFLKYPANSAGSIMTIEYAELRANSTVAEAIERLRKTGLDKETIYTCYIIGEGRKLLGFVELRHLIIANPNEILANIMNSNVISVKTTDDRETVADIVRKYDLLSLPVTDTEGRLVGIVTVDDIIDVLDAENTEDMELMRGLLPSDDEYMKTPVTTLFTKRIPWLLILMVSATFTGMIITHFEGVLSTTGRLGVLLTACLPMLMDTGGNCGSQASTLVIRSIALGQINFTDFFHVWWREVRVAFLVGLTLCIANVARQLLLYTFTDGVTIDTVTVTFVVSFAMFLTVIIAKSIGCLLPLFAEKIKLDPAIMAGPIITTIVDACALTILFTIATKFL